MGKITKVAKDKKKKKTHHSKYFHCKRPLHCEEDGDDEFVKKDPITGRRYHSELNKRILSREELFDIFGMEYLR